MNAFGLISQLIGIETLRLTDISIDICGYIKPYLINVFVYVKYLPHVNKKF